MSSELDIIIRSSEIVCAKIQLKFGKSGDIDLLINELFVHDADLLLPSLTQLFNSVVSSGYFPAKWAETNNSANPQRRRCKQL